MGSDSPFLARSLAETLQNKNKDQNRSPGSRDKRDTEILPHLDPSKTA